MTRSARPVLFAPLNNYKRRQWAVRQPRVEGGRIPVTGGLDPAVADRVRQECQRFDVSPQFVMSVALGDFFGVKLTRY